MEKHIHLSFSLLSFFTVAIALSLPRATFSDQSPSYLGFTVDATDMPSEEYYDYIIVGGGTAGCPLAATLSERHKVLLLERGGIPFGKPNLMTQDGFLATLVDVDNFDSPAQGFTSEDGVPNARGRVLGGSSAINAGFYSRADQEFYEKSGIKWDMKLVNESYEWVENEIVFQPELKSWQSAVLDGFIEANMGPYNGFSLDHHLGIKIGGSTFDSAGRRHSAADLLIYANSSNIRVAVRAIVERVIFPATSSPPSPPSPPPPANRPSAIGVVYRDKIGMLHWAMLKDNGEVLLSAGALGSPQLLLLSGIGPRAYLTSWEIPVVRDHPFVGQFLYDNPRNGISIVPSMPLEHSLIQVVGITSSGTYLEAASNVISFNTGTNGAFIRRSDYPVYFTVATLMEKIVGPLSAGSLKLASTDIKANPVVNFNYFLRQEDLHRCINGSRKIHEVLQSRSMEGFKHQHWSGQKDFRYVGAPLPGDVSNDLLMEAFCRLTVTTIWHYHGGCIVGKVVDRNFKVYGVNALRVIDGSTFTVSPGTNPQATVLMLGRYVGQKILSSRTGIGEKTD